MKFQTALSSMDLIAVLNKDFTGKVKQKELNISKVAKYLHDKGFVPYGTDGSLEQLEQYIEENDAAFTNEFYFDDLNSTRIETPYSCIFEMIANELGFVFRALPSLYIGEPDSVTTDSGVTTIVDCTTDAEVNYIKWWCEQFGIEYEENGMEIGFKDFSEENEMSFLFLYKDNELKESCAIDWSSGFDNVSGDMGQILADNDIDFKFSRYANSDKASKIIYTLNNMISETKEVVF